MVSSTRSSRASLRQRDAGLAGQPLDRLREGQPLRLHQEGEDVAVLAGREAVVELLLVVHVEGRRLLGIERRQPLPLPPGLLQPHRFARPPPRPAAGRGSLRGCGAGSAIGSVPVRDLISSGHPFNQGGRACQTGAADRDSVRSRRFSPNIHIGEGLGILGSSPRHERHSHCCRHSGARRRCEPGTYKR